MHSSHHHAPADQAVPARGRGSGFIRGASNRDPEDIWNDGVGKQRITNGLDFCHRFLSFDFNFCRPAIRYRNPNGRKFPVEVEIQR